MNNKNELLFITKTLFFVIIIASSCFSYKQTHLWGEIDLSKDIEMHLNSRGWYYQYIILGNDNNNITHFILMSQSIEFGKYYPWAFIKDVQTGETFYYECNKEIFKNLNNLNKNNGLSDIAYDIVITNESLNCSLHIEYDKALLLNRGNGIVPLGNKSDTSYYFTIPSQKVSGILETTCCSLNLNDTSIIKHAWFDHQWGNFALSEDENRWFWAGIFNKNNDYIMAATFSNSNFNFVQYTDNHNNSFVYDSIHTVTATYRKSEYTNEIYEHGWVLSNNDNSVYLFFDPICYDNEIVEANWYSGICKVNGFVFKNEIDGLGAFELNAPYPKDYDYPYHNFSKIYEQQKYMIIEYLNRLNNNELNKYLKNQYRK